MMKSSFRCLWFSIAIILCCLCGRSERFSLSQPHLGQKPPGLIPEVFAPGIVSTDEYKEFGCTFTPDGKEFYFTRGSIERRRNTIMISRFTRGGWTEPTFADFSGIYYDDEPHVSIDGTWLFFGSERPKPVESEREYGLWMMKRTRSGWGEPQYYGIGMYVTSTQDRTIFYTVRTGENDWGIVRARYVDDRFTEPELLGGGSNSPYFDAHPCIAPDESFMVFDSKRPGAVGGEGDLDLYVCFRDDAGSWGDAIHLGERINSPVEDHVPSLSHDGKYLFFARGEPERWDIYWVSTESIEASRPAETLRKWP